MNIYKIGHCCLVITERGVKIMTDPGNVTTEQNKITGLDAIIITHSHADHLDVDAFPGLLLQNTDVRVIANKEIAEFLLQKNIRAEVLQSGEVVNIKGITIEAEDHAHMRIYDGVNLPQNTGFYIEETLYLPGDSLEIPKKRIEILALPVSAPWERVSDALDFVKAVKPKKAFPVHDGMQKIYGSWHERPKTFLPQWEIEFIPLMPGEYFNVSE